MEVSDKGLRYLIQSEVAIPYVYDDGDGTWPKRRITSFKTKGYPTIGVGHRIYPDEQEQFRKYLGTGQSMPEAEIMELLHRDINKRIATPDWKARILVPITQSMYDALVHQAFNTGPTANSVRTAIAAINRKDWLAAQEALANGPVTSKGKRLETLVKRRAFEASYFMEDGEPGLVEAVPTWAWVTGGSIGALLLLWGAVRLRRYWIQRP